MNGLLILFTCYEVLLMIYGKSTLSIDIDRSMFFPLVVSLRLLAIIIFISNDISSRILFICCEALTRSSISRERTHTGSHGQIKTEFMHREDNADRVTITALLLTEEASKIS